MFGHGWGFFGRGGMDRAQWAAARGGHRGGPHHGGGHGGPGGGEGPFGFGRGPGGFPGGGFPRGFPFSRGMGEFFGPGRRMRPPSVRAAILSLLAEQPRNGYQLMQEVEQRSRGMWRPSPGSVYPALQQLEDEGLVSAETSGTGRTFQLTAQGHEHVKAHPDEATVAWESLGGGESMEQAFELMQQIGQIAMALKQVSTTGTAAQVAEAKKIVADARRALYRLLAEDEPGEE